MQETIPFPPFRDEATFEIENAPGVSVAQVHAELHEQGISCKGCRHNVTREETRNAAGQLVGLRYAGFGEQPCDGCGHHYVLRWV